MAGRQGYFLAAVWRFLGCLGRFLPDSGWVAVGVVG